MSAVYWVVGAVALQRLVELVIARRNTARLMASGAVEVAGDIYPALVLLHVFWLGAIVVFVPPGTPPNWILLTGYIALQGVRIWTMASLGRYWTTRLISAPDAPVVRSGPYRFLRHPNYWVVAAEIALLPLVFGEYEISLIFTICNAILLSHRIKLENRSLALREG
jgi:methyltransferase